jgi:hypothetical protein
MFLRRPQALIFRQIEKDSIMKRFAMFALFLGLTCVLGCEPPKPAAKPVTEAPVAGTDTTPATEPATETPPAEGEKPADGAAK